MTGKAELTPQERAQAYRAAFEARTREAVAQRVHAEKTRRLDAEIDRALSRPDGESRKAGS